jgi:hypothetical protein
VASVLSNVDMGIWTDTLYTRGVLCIDTINLMAYRVELDSLFWVVCCVCKNPRKDSTFHTVAAGDEHPVRIRIYKIFIEHQVPDLLHELDLEKAQNFGRC